MASECKSCASRWLPIVGIIAIVAGVAAYVLWPASEPKELDVAFKSKGIAAFQTTDNLVVTFDLDNDEDNVVKGELKVEVVDAAGNTVVSTNREIQQDEGVAHHRVELPALKQSPEDLKLLLSFGGKRREAPLSDVLLVKAHETAVSTSREFHAGSRASLRCEVRGVKSITETVPLSNASVQVRLRSDAGDVYALYDDKVGDDGIADAQFTLPDVEAGRYKLEVETRSHLGHEKLEQDVEIKSLPKILLVTDKPLYQPGQTIHVRALSLGAFDLRPVKGKTVLFEIEDPKGNKVFKSEQKASDYGIASVDFDLATELNQGEYRIRALLDKHQSEKTVTVKPYVLPKFRTSVTTDKTFYQPGETLKGDLQVSYFFGKPVANGTVEVTASTLDAGDNKFQTWNGKTDENGHVSFEINLPEKVFGIPLQKGDALVKLDVMVTDTADQKVSLSKTYPVSKSVIQVSMIPEAGKLVPGVENRVHVAAVRPDGSPAQASVKVWLGARAQGEPMQALTTNSAGLAELRFTPEEKQFRRGGMQQQKVEVLGGNVQQFQAPAHLLDLCVRATDKTGAQSEKTVQLTSEPFGDNLLLRLDKAIYNGGDKMQIDVRSTAGTPTAYVDVIRDGQTVLTKWLDVKQGKALHLLDLPASLFGTLEVHAYQMLGGGEIIRDSRVVYVQPASNLNVKVKPSKDTYRPDEKGVIQFEVTDANGKPTAAALGVIIVDEAVYALQEMQPGLEKVYFTLQKELLKPRVQVDYQPRESLPELVREQQLPVDKQQIAQVLLTAAETKPMKLWQVNGASTRERELDFQLHQIGQLLYDYASTRPHDAIATGGQWKDDVLASALQAGREWKPSLLIDPLGNRLTASRLAKLKPSFTPDRLAAELTQNKLTTFARLVQNGAHRNPAWRKGNRWTIPKDKLSDLASLLNVRGNNAHWLNDGWGRPIRLIEREERVAHQLHNNLFDHYEVVSVGADGKPDTDDDVKLTTWNREQFYGLHLFEPERKLNWSFNVAASQFLRKHQVPQPRQFAAEGHAVDAAAVKADFDGANLGAVPQRGALAGNVPPAPEERLLLEKAKAESTPDDGEPGKGNASEPARVRKYFPETMLWQPSVITDEHGRATMNVRFADSITTWRLTASASSRDGLLGGATEPLRVFQDFFVDMDLPVNLTQNDEVTFPVAVYNYLKTPQTVTVELEKKEWFDLLVGEAKQSIALKPGEVLAVKYRIRAKKIGKHPLKVNAVGSVKPGDAVLRTIEVVPDGKAFEQVATDRLTGNVSETINVPENAIPDASKLFVKIHPGVFSQVLEGADGMLRMPSGCFEQTSSSAYPNILIVDYINRMKIGTPEMKMKAESYLNAGYQRLLTFERPGGGFDWWGSGPPLVWLSAYGLQEFSDMSKVWPIDQGIITRTQQYLIREQDKTDGTWSKIGDTHGESITRMGDPKLLLTSYVTWSLLESGYDKKRLEKSIAYIRKKVKDCDNAYVLALAANALAWSDADDDSTRDVLKRLSEKPLRKDLPEIKACCYPAKGQSLYYARGDALTVETTAMTVLAMIKANLHHNQISQGLTYLIKQKGAHGTWGSTQATILALKALVDGAGGQPHDGVAKFTILVNDVEAGKGEITAKNSDVMQQFDLSGNVQPGDNVVSIKVDRETSVMYQVVGRHFMPWTDQPAKDPVLTIDVDYDRKELATNDRLEATAKLKYNGDQSTYQVIVDLGIPPGFSVDPGEFAEWVASKKIERFSVTSRQVTLYLGKLNPGDAKSFTYYLTAKYPIKAKTPVTKVYEYYTPKHRAEAKPVQLTVTEKP